MKYLALSALILCASTGWAQNRTSDSGLGSGTAAQLGEANPSAGQRKIPNPFDPKPEVGGMAGMGMGMGMEMEEMDGMEMGMGDMMDMDMGMGGMMDMGSGPSPDQLFRRGLQRAIQALKKAKTDADKEVLRGYIRTAFEDRYSKMIADRHRDLERLKQSVAKLESDLKRRESAKDRVVQVQMQSVQLAAEGLLELGELRGVERGMAGSGGSGYGGMEEYMEDRDF